MGLILIWALPPIGLQLAAGGDILWQRRWSVVPALSAITVYLCGADALAIGSGVWTIDPAQSLPARIGGVLPIEEAIFFLVTTTLVVFGLTLSLAAQRRVRWMQLRPRADRRRSLPKGA